MKETKADLILHPIRMRIILTLVGGRQLSGLQLVESLPDIPQATLYRHLNKLAKGGILKVVEQRQVRGAVEKVYAVLSPAVNLTQEDLANATREDHLRYFTTFMAGLLGDFERYLQKDNVDLVADGVGYRQIPLYLSDSEFLEFMNGMSRLVAGAYANPPAPGRRLRLLSTVIMPGVETPAPKEE